MSFRLVPLAAAAAVIALACGDDRGPGAPTLPADAQPADAAAADGDAATPACTTPGATTCADPLTRQVCDDQGQVVLVACPEDFGCRDGACVPQVCTPGAGTGVCVSETSHERCADSGTQWELHECPGGHSCRVGVCAGPICTPGARICGGFFVVHECNEAGDAFEEAEQCPPGSACADGECLSPCQVNVKDGSYLGCEYWATDLGNVEEAAGKAIGLVVSVPLDGARTEVRITNTATGGLLNGAALGVADLFVEPGAVKVFALPTGFDIDGTGLTTNTFRLTTTSPVSVHQFNPLNGAGVYSNDASLLLPSQVTGGDYIVMAWPHREDAIATLRGFATVVATMPGSTEVQVTPTAAIAPSPGVAGIAAGTTRIFQLAQGQAINLTTAGSDHGDLTGTLIRANRQISVMAGHECANVPVGVSACDHLESQLFPVNSWGNRYVADAFEARSPSQIDIWRVMGGANGVTVTTNPPVPGYEEFELQRGTWVQFASSGSFEVVADGPIKIGHYLTGSAYPGAIKVCADSGLGPQSALGDPAFTLSVPVSRYLKRYAVLTPSGYRDDYLNIIARVNATVTVDGAPLDVPLVPVGDSGWGVARKRVSPGVHEIVGSSELGLTAYGYDCDVSYAYPGGLQLQGSQDLRQGTR